MRRVGYDADTQKYTFEDENGDLWEGSQGAEYGEMTRGTSVYLRRPPLNLTHSCTAQWERRLPAALLLKTILKRQHQVETEATSLSLLEIRTLM